MLPRTSSNVLSFKLREFLDTSDPVMDWEAAIQTAATRPTSTLCADEPPPLTSKEEVVDTRVWVDCFFYGFYLDEKDVAAFQKTDSKPSPLTPLWARR